MLNRRKFFSQPWAPLAYCLIFSYLILIILTFTHYGIGWDEKWQSNYGEYVIRWYTSTFQDRDALTYRNMMYYGGFFDVIAQLSTRVSPLGAFETRHLVNALFGLLAVVGTFKLGKFYGGPPLGLLSALFLVLTPRFYGDAFANPKDIPFAALFLFSLYYIIKCVRFMPRLSAELLIIIKLGIAIGLTLAIRVGGVLLLGYLGLAFCLWAIREYAWKDHDFSELMTFRSAVTAFARCCLGICVIAYAVMVVWWPYAQTQPVIHPLKALWKISHYDWPNEVFFEGRLIAGNEIPWYYIVKWLLITLPEFYFLGLAIGLVFAGFYVTGSYKARTRGRPVEYFILFFSIIFPIIYVMLSGTVLYDGVRHFLFIIPPLAIVAALPMTHMPPHFKRKPVVTAVTMAIVVSVAVTVVDMVQLHPYEYVYFNRVFGKGVREAGKSFETDYWGYSYKEGVEWIVKNHNNSIGDRKIKVASCSFPTSTKYYLPVDGFDYVGSYDYSVGDRPDVFLATTRRGCHETLGGRVLHVVMRKGTPFLYIKEVDESARAMRPY